MQPLLIIAAIYAIVSLVTFIAYGIDKHRAKAGKWRISEHTLHLLELCGGWPGGAAGQALFKHKRRKFSYMAIFAGIVALHLAAWAAWIAEFKG